MTQFPPAVVVPPPAQPPAKTSGLAVTALILSLVLCLPVLPLIGAILGLAALGATRKPNMKGHGLAVGAIIAGLLITLLQAGGTYGVYKAIQAGLEQIQKSAQQFVTDYNAGNDRAIYDRANSNFKSRNTYSSLHAELERARTQWGDAQMMAVGEMAKNGFAVETVNDRTTMEVPLRFSKAGVRKIRLVLEERNETLELVELEFVGLSGGDSESEEP